MVLQTTKDLKPADAQSPLTKPETRIIFFSIKSSFSLIGVVKQTPLAVVRTTLADVTCLEQTAGIFIFSIHFIKNIYVSVKRENEIFKLIVSSTNPSINQNSNKNKRGK